MRDDLVFGVQIEAAPDRLRVASILFISRSGVILLGVDGLNRPTSLHEILFPHTLENESWANRVEASIFEIGISERNVVLVVVDGIYELIVPDTLAEPNLIDPTFSLAFTGQAGTDSVAHSHIEGLQAEAFISIPFELKLVLDKSAISAKVMGAQAILGSSIARLAKSTDELMVIHLSPENMRVGVATNGKLSFINSFEITADGDALYFALAACKASGIDPQKTNLSVGFHNVEVDSTLRLLSNYFKQVNAIESHSYNQWPYTFSKLAKGQYHLLFEAIQCA